MAVTGYTAPTGFPAVSTALVWSKCLVGFRFSQVWPDARFHWGSCRRTDQLVSTCTPVTVDPNIGQPGFTLQRHTGWNSSTVRTGSVSSKSDSSCAGPRTCSNSFAAMRLNPRVQEFPLVVAPLSSNLRCRSSLAANRDHRLRYGVSPFPCASLRVHCAVSSNRFDGESL